MYSYILTQHTDTKDVFSSYKDTSNCFTHKYNLNVFLVFFVKLQYTFSDELRISANYAFCSIHTTY